MTSKKPYIQIRTTNEIIQKFSYIAVHDKRSMSNLGEIVVRKYIEAYEAEHGEIKIEHESSKD